MGETLILEYDKIGDILFIDVCAPYAKQDSNEIGECIVARFNLETGEIETVEILFLFSWLKKEGEIRIPVTSELRVANSFLSNANGESPSTAVPLTIKYDFEGDTLKLYLREPGSGQDEAEICDGATARLNPESGEIESLEIRSFKARAERDGEIVLPIKATFRQAKSAVPAE